MKRSYVIGGIVAAAVIAGGGAATGVALAGSGGSGTGYGSTTTAQAGTPAAPASLGTAALKPGTALVDGAGRTLYLFEADKGTTSTCNGQCAQIWMPLQDTGAAPSATGAVQATLVGTTTRDDGTKQVTYNGHPLYYFMGDKAPGDARGQGINRFGGSWYVVTAAGNKIDPDDDAPAAAPAPAPAPAAAPAAGAYGY